MPYRVITVAPAGAMFDALTAILRVEGCVYEVETDPAAAVVACAGKANPRTACAVIAPDGSVLTDYAALAAYLTAKGLRRI